MPIYQETDLIVLIGPMKAGKSTVGKLLAETLHIPFKSLDGVEKDYILDAGFDEKKATAIQNSQGDLAWYEYRRTFFDIAVIGFLKDYRTGVLELGGGHPILPTQEKQDKVNKALSKLPNVILLLPTPDIPTSLKILNGRQRPKFRDPDFNEIFLADERFFDLAKTVFYTQDKSPSELCGEIIVSLASPNNVP